MSQLYENPVIFLIGVVALLFAAGCAGAWFNSSRSSVLGETSESLKTIEGAVLGLLALLLGFSFAMSVNRYDLRKQLEVDEANAIGTTWLRAGALLEPARSTEQQLLREYVPVRLEFFSAGMDRAKIDQSLDAAGVLQKKMWAAGSAEAAVHRDPITALFLSSLNDSIDATEKRTAAFENRIPIAAWVLLLFMASAANALIGVGASRKARPLLVVLPFVVGAAMMLIRNLDSSRAGFIRVHQGSMERVARDIQQVP